VTELGFEEMLQFDECDVPRSFAQWIADSASFEGEEILIAGQSIKMNFESMKQTLGIPSGSECVDCDEEEGKLSFLAQFALTDLPPIKYFGNMIINDDLPDAVFKRCFMVVTCGTFLCPTSSTKPSTKYLGALVDVDKIKSLNWCKYVHQWLVCYIKKYLKDKMKQNRKSLTLGGFIYHTAVSL
jgi:hypothetical protein